MLSISAAKTAGGAASYFSDHLTTENASNPNEDYYTSGEPGNWLGAGAVALGLNGEVNKEDFARILLALDEKGDSLLYRQKPKSERRAGWDLTFSAPKSVSAIWAIGETNLRQQIQQAHDEAVKSAMNYLQENGGIAARRGKGGQQLEQAKLVAATFNHATSREQDPQLHSHNLVMNLAQRDDGSWGSVQSREFFKLKMEVGTLYRVALSNKLQEMGFDIERDKKSFKIKEVPDALIKKWSKRRAQVLDSMSKNGWASAKSAEIAALTTRKKKTEITQQVLKNRWTEEAAEHGFTAEKIEEIRQQEQQKRSMPAPENFWLELTQNRSTVSKSQLKTAVFEHAQGVLSIDDAQQYYNEIIKNENTIILTDENNNLRFTSLEMFELEKLILEQSKQRQNEQHQVSDQAMQAAYKSAPGLSNEQQNMLEHITSKAGVAVVEGMAGTGKSYALNAARAAYEADGKKVKGAALAGKAAAGLEESAGIKSQTLHSLLAELDDDKKQLDNHTVIVIDESGMVGSRQLQRILDYAEQAQAKVVLVGDSKQLQPIDAGAAFRGLSGEIGAASLTEIRRQNESWARQAVSLFAAGEAALALEMYNERGLLKSASSHEKTIEVLIKNWRKYVDQTPDNIENSLILAATKSDVYQLNQAARQSLEEHLGKESININNREFRENDRILMTRNNKKMQIQNGDVGTVESIDNEQQRLSVKFDKGKTIEIAIDQYDHVDHGYAVTTHKSQGATVDRAFVLSHESLSGREWSYVAASRAREETTIYADEETLIDLNVAMSRSDAKDFSQDYSSQHIENKQNNHEIEI